jgi:hypothetical protein
MTFRSLNLAATLLCAVLAVVLIFLPGLIYFIFNVDGAAVGDFLAKRAGMLFLGLAALLYASRDAGVSTARTAISPGLAVAMGGLAVTGVYEFVRGYAGPGIWLAILAETGFAAGYGRVYFREARA